MVTRPSYSSLSEVSAKNVLLNVVNVNLTFSRTTWARKCEPTHFFFTKVPPLQTMLNVKCVCESDSSPFEKNTNTTHTNTHPRTLQRPSRLSVRRRQACGSKTVNISKAIGIHYSIIQHRQLKASGWDWAFTRQAGGNKKKRKKEKNSLAWSWTERQHTATCADERMSRG